MKCTNCNAELEAGTKFCTKCGTPVPEGTVPAQTVSEAPKQNGGSMKCTNCNAELEVGTKFCTKCGTPVPEGTVPAQTVSEAVVPEAPKQNGGSMKCAKCNAVLEGGAKFCTLCGHPVPEGVVPGDPQQFDFGKIMNTTKAFFASAWSKAKPACAKAWGKIKGVAKTGDEKLGEKLGDKKMYAYAGVIGLIGIILVVASIIAIIPNGNGFLTYNANRLRTIDETIYVLEDGKAATVNTSAESIQDRSTSIDGKVTVFQSEDTLYSLKGKKTKEIADNVTGYELSLYGDYVVYVEQDGDDITYYHCKVSNGKATEIFESSDDEYLVCYAISPNGKNVAYVTVDEEYEGTLYYFNGKKSTKITKCNSAVVGLSDGGKYIYCVEESKSGKTSLMSYNKKGKETKIDSCDYDDGFSFNLDASEIMFTSGGKTYISAKAKEPVKLASDSVYLITPNHSYTYETNANSEFLPIDTLFGHVYSSGDAAYLSHKKESKNIKLVKGFNFTLDDSGKYLYYMDKTDLMVLKISKGEKAEDKAKLIAEDVIDYRITSNRKFAYFIDEDGELSVANGKKGGKIKKISNDELDSPYFTIDSKDIVYYTCDDSVYAAKGKKAGKEIIDEAEIYNYGGSVYFEDEDDLYTARGTKSPKKLISLD